MSQRWVTERCASLELLGEEPSDVVPLCKLEGHRLGLVASAPARARARRGRYAPRAASRAETFAPRRGNPAAQGRCRHRSPPRGRRPGSDGPWQPSGVPISTARSAARKRSIASRSAPGRAAVSASSRMRCELGHLPLELRLEPLRARTDLGELRRPARRARLGYLFRIPAVMTVQAPVTMQRERDVTVGGSAATTRRRGSGPPVRRRGG